MLDKYIYLKTKTNKSLSAGGKVAVSTVSGEVGRGRAGLRVWVLVMTAGRSH